MIAIPRKIIQIDQELCNGCALCVDTCAEAAIEMVDGKAVLLSDTYCDGLGACLGECPTGAITIEERLAEAFDEVAVEHRLAQLGQGSSRSIEEEHLAERSENNKTAKKFGGCPSSAMRSFQATGVAHDARRPGAFGDAGSQLSQWPVQLRLVPPTAPYLRGRELVIAADCVSYAYAGFHRDFLVDRSLVIACPKLDDLHRDAKKLSTMFKMSGITGVTVVYMEVPCCHQLVATVERMLVASCRSLPIRKVMIGIDGTFRSVHPE